MKASANELCEEFTAVLLGFAAPGRTAVTLGGSQAKGKSDHRSDYDFRLYADAFITEDWEHSPGWQPWREAVEKWTAQGFRIDDFWPRRINDIDAALDLWSAGQAAPELLVWSVWGYHLPTDIACQRTLFDPDGVAAAWHARLAVYPPALQAALLQKHLEFVRYWRGDYHYQSKVERGDALFLAGLSAKLVHSLCQILCALNETDYPGDGWNAEFIDGFALAPPQFGERAAACLYPAPGPDRFARQRAELVTLIGEVETLAARAGGGYAPGQT